MEGEYIIGAVLDGQSVTIEPGGQFELSGAPVDTLHKTCSEVNSHLYQVFLLSASCLIASDQPGVCIQCFMYCPAYRHTHTGIDGALHCLLCCLQLPV